MKAFARQNQFTTLRIMQWLERTIFLTQYSVENFSVGRMAEILQRGSRGALPHVLGSGWNAGSSLSQALPVVLLHGSIGIGGDLGHFFHLELRFF